MMHGESFSSSPLWMLPLANMIVAPLILVGVHPAIDTQAGASAQEFDIGSKQSAMPFESLIRNGNQSLFHRSVKPITDAISQDS